MGRNNSDFHESRLFHGTVHPFKPGDMITPDPQHHEHAYATESVDYAKDVAHNRVYNSWEDKKKENPTWNMPGGKQWKDYQAETPPRVFQVAPASDMEDASKEGGGDAKHYRSRTGFRVIKEIK